MRRWHITASTRTWMSVGRREATVPQKLYLDECTSALLTERLRGLDPQASVFSTIEHATQVHVGYLTLIS